MKIRWFDLIPALIVLPITLNFLYYAYTGNSFLPSVPGEKGIGLYMTQDFVWYFGNIGTLAILLNRNLK